VSDEPAVVVEELRVVRGGKVVLPAVSARVAAGRVTGLLGPSGSGKSTLIRAVAGIQLGVSGTVRVLGRPAGAAELRRRVG
jgi:ABC-2 type transport system ATP-binding protein